MAKVVINEPVHRVAPEPVSSGISFRKLPRASLIELGRVCDHYEAKGAGTYGRGSKATRYVYDMAKEVRQIIRGLEEEERAASLHTQHLERIVGEWHDVFGRLGSPELAEHFPAGTKLTPASLYAKLREYAERIRSLESTLQRLSAATGDRDAKYEVALAEAEALAAARLDAALAEQAREAKAAADKAARDADARIAAAEARYVEACRDVFEYKSAEGNARVRELATQLERERAANIELGKENELLLHTLQGQLEVQYAASEARWQNLLATSEAAHASELEAQAQYYESIIDALEAGLPATASAADKRLGQLLTQLTRAREDRAMRAAGGGSAAAQMPLPRLRPDNPEQWEDNTVSWRSMYEAKRKELAFQLAANAALVKELAHLQTRGETPAAAAALGPKLEDARQNEAMLQARIEQLMDMIQAMEHERNNAELMAARTAVSDLRVPWALPYVSSLRKQRRNEPYAPAFVGTGIAEAAAQAEAHNHDQALDQLRVVHH
ncbi:uncharacterized protein AMSG_04383 [Thecamonas trahens ATCC 50062]|uniref:Uncharacterized protein n=1 Tax=Thecamonas trahens ATCC 50062 TaxID=461836 RepID=A0A0L0D731_THETB|nr:hypothetical protein AMSG_04383 [Thecamonas trahens ATCC 50062]KNC48154.1 hypothetical protein AMSG_04383 [Thecamonas trahens ATCC 50062]|eukprot:XP_013758724.1 hypothetical protein AMSG_04383 [Thecamonas trahens ATCC 50062]